MIADQGWCRDCGQGVLWVKTVRGKNMPLDPEPCREGHVTIDPAGRAVSHGDGDRDRALRSGVTVWRCHFASCPHRRRRSGDSQRALPPDRYDDGYRDGRQRGYQEGCADGYTEGFLDGGSPGLDDRLLLRVIRLCHPDHQPPERFAEANSVTAALTALREELRR